MRHVLWGLASFNELYSRFYSRSGIGLVFVFSDESEPKYWYRIKLEKTVSEPQYQKQEVVFRAAPISYKVCPSITER